MNKRLSVYHGLKPIPVDLHSVLKEGAKGLENPCPRKLRIVWIFLGGLRNFFKKSDSNNFLRSVCYFFFNFCF